MEDVSNHFEQLVFASVNSPLHIFLDGHICLKHAAPDPRQSELRLELRIAYCY